MRAAHLVSRVSAPSLGVAKESGKDSVLCLRSQKSMTTFQGQKRTVGATKPHVAEEETGRGGGLTGWRPGSLLSLHKPAGGLACGWTEV